MLKKILVALIAFVITIVIAGFVLELFKTDKQQQARYMRTRNVFQYQPGNVVFDPILGYMTSPNLNVSFNNEEFNTNIRTNELGLRDDHASIKEAQTIFLGDSYVWGWGVDEQLNIEKQYENITGKKVLNAGVPGYGNVQEILLLHKLQRLIPLQSKQIFLFFCANDFIDNQNTSFNAFPYFIKSGEMVKVSEPSIGGFNEWLDAANSWTIHSNFAQHSILWYDVCAGIKNISTKDLYRDHETTKDRLNGIQAFLMAADDLYALQQAYGCSVSIVYIPPAGYYQTKQFDRSYPIVKDACHKIGLNFIDLSPVLSADDYYPLDLHWKSSGHQKAAAFIASFVNIR